VVPMRVLYHLLLPCTVGGVDFWIFSFLQLVIDWQNNSKSKDEKVFFFIFYVSLCGNEFLKRKKSLKSNFFYIEIGRYGVSIFVSSSYQKIEPKNSIL
jgi:hypothetical protein